MKLLSVLIILSISANTWASTSRAAAAGGKTKREFYAPQGRFITSNGLDKNNDNIYYEQGRKFKNNPDADSKILKQVEEKHPDGSYNYEYETENGIRAQETSVQNGNERIVRGSYSYIAPDGLTYTVNYIADRNGYRAYGAHLPTQPDAVADVVNRAQQIVLSQVPSAPVYRQNLPSSNLHTQFVPSSTYTPTYSSTVQPIYNRQTASPSYASTVSPILRQTLASPTQSPYGLSTTPSPFGRPILSNGISQSIFPTAAGGVVYSSTPSPFVSSTQSPITFGSTTQRPYTSITPGYSPETEETVYITPAPPTRPFNRFENVPPLTSQNYIERELLPPFAIGLQQSPSAYENNFNIGIPNVRPLYERDPIYAYRPNGFEPNYRRYRV